MGFSLGTWTSGSDYQTNMTSIAIPYSMAIWAKPTGSLVAFSYFLSMFQSGLGRYASIGLAANSSGVFRCYDGTNLDSGQSANLLNWNAWNHVCGVQNSTSNSRLVYVNNTSTALTSTIAVPPSNGEVNLGGLSEGSTLGAGNGNCKLAYAAIWGTSLTASEITSLQTLYPDQVNAANLLHYWKFESLPLNDSASVQWNFSVSGSDSVIDNADFPSLSSSGASSITTKVRYFRNMQMGD